MAIPKYDEITLPMLQLLSDGKTVESSSLVTKLADHFKLTASELEEMLPSGIQRVFVNRVGWAKTHLYKAGLIDNSVRGWVKITDLGIKILSEKPEKLDNKYLFKFSSFKDFFKGSKSKTKEEDTSPVASSRTPDEIMESIEEELKAQLKAELKKKIMEISPYQFEKLVVKVLLALGYGNNEKESGIALGKSGDGGVDGVINQDKLGIDEIYIQAKQFTTNSVGRDVVQSFVGALHGKRSRKGVFITTSHFSSGAIEYAKSIETKVILIDGERLTELMYGNDVGVKIEKSYVKKGLDLDFFEEWV